MAALFERHRIHALLAKPIARFMAIGIVSTAAYAAIVYVLIGPVGSSAANLLALAITAVANTAANRRFTFGVRGRAQVVRQYAASLVVFLIALAITDGALALLDHYDPRPSRPADLSVLVLGTLVATVCRFAALKLFVFRSAGRRPADPTRRTPVPVRPNP
jgi:putative flippase GtrA